MEGPFNGPVEHKVTGLSDVIGFDCCTAVPEDLGAFKISYAENTLVPTGVHEVIHKPVNSSIHTLSYTHSSMYMPPFAFQRGIIAQGGGRGSVASGFPESACEVNES